MSLYKLYKTDEKKLESGIRVPIGMNDDKTIPTFILTRAHKSNVRYAKSLERETKPYRRQIELGTMDNMLAEAISRRVFIETCLLDWENVQDEKNQPLALTHENAEKLFTDLPDLYDELYQQSTKASAFLEESLELEAKN